MENQNNSDTSFEI